MPLILANFFIIICTRHKAASYLLQLSEAMKAMKSHMNADQELRDKSQKELEVDLTATKHNLLDVRHQLNMAEKVGEAESATSHKKFLWSILCLLPKNTFLPEAQLTCLF